MNGQFLCHCLQRSTCFVRRETKQCSSGEKSQNAGNAKNWLVYWRTFVTVQPEPSSWPKQARQQEKYIECAYRQRRHPAGITAKTAHPPEFCRLNQILCGNVLASGVWHVDADLIFKRRPRPRQVILRGCAKIAYWTCAGHGTEPAIAWR